MDELQRNIASGVWWLSVVLVGIVLNVASAYLKSPLDWLFSRLSVAWSERSIKARNARAAKVLELSGSEHGQHLVLADEMRFRLRSISYLVFSVVFLVATFVAEVRPEMLASSLVPVTDVWMRNVTGAMAQLTLFLSLYQHAAASRRAALIEDAQVVRPVSR